MHAICLESLKTHQWSLAIHRALKFSMKYFFKYSYGRLTMITENIKFGPSGIISNCQSAVMNYILPSTCLDIMVLEWSTWNWLYPGHTSNVWITFKTDWNIDDGNISATLGMVVHGHHGHTWKSEKLNLDYTIIQLELQFLHCSNRNTKT